MRKTQRPPTGEPMLDDKGVLTPLWHRWFTDMSATHDQRRKPPDTVCTTHRHLTTDDFGKVIVMDCTSASLNVFLPEITEKDLYCFISIFRKGSNRIIIKPTATTRIEYGSYGGMLFCDEVDRAAANLTLQVLTTTQWGITGGTGIWKTA